MKKYFKLLTVTSVILFALTFVSCGLLNAFKDSVEESYNQWYKYKSGDKQINIPVLAANVEDNDSQAESTETLKNAEIYFYYDSDNGLKVAVQTSSTQNVSMLEGLYTQEMKVVMGSIKQYTTEEFGKVKWTALWTTGKLEESSEPKISSNPDECIILGADNKPKIQWKKFLANYLLNQFIED